MSTTDRAEDRGHREYVDEVLELLWPGHLRIMSRRPRRTGMLLLPSDEPRLALPRRPRRVAATALRNYNTAAAGVGRGRLALGSLALRLGAGALVPGGVETTGEGGIVDELADRLGREVMVSLYLGPPRVGQKPVLQVLDPGGDTIAFAKLGLSDRAAALVANEAATLQRIATLPLRHLRVPKVLHDGTWRGCRLLVQQALRGHRRSTAVAQLRHAAARELFDAWGYSLEPVGGSAFGSRLKERTDGLGDRIVCERLREAVRIADQRTGGTVLRMGAGHGDWTPWNVTAARATLHAWDWEAFEPNAPCGCDELHWRLNQAVALEGRPAGRAVVEMALAAPDLLAPLGVDASQARVTALWYALDLATRYAADGEDLVGGTALSRLDTWLAQAMDVLLAPTTPGRGR